MAERVMVVCDVCGKASVETVGISAAGKNYRKDLCSEHLADLLRGTRAPKAGRPARAAAVVTAAPRRRGRPPKAAAAATKATAKATAKAAPAKASPKASAPKRERKKITDPVILEKRRAALVKARKARADKRAAAAGA